MFFDFLFTLFAIIFSWLDSFLPAGNSIPLPIVDIINGGAWFFTYIALFENLTVLFWALGIVIATEIALWAFHAVVWLWELFPGN